MIYCQIIFFLFDKRWSEWKVKTKCKKIGFKLKAFKKNAAAVTIPGSIIKCSSWKTCQWAIEVMTHGQGLRVEIKMSDFSQKM